MGHDPFILQKPHIARLLDPGTRKAMGVQTREEIDAKFDQRAEKELQHQIANFLRLADIWFDQDAMHRRRRGTVGTPDFLFAYRGIPCAVEAKTATGQLRHEQAKAHEAMRRNGWLVIVARCLADVQGLLRAIDKDKP